MRDKPLAMVIALTGGAVAVLGCLIRGVSLLWTLLYVLLSIIAFSVIGSIVNYIYMKIRKEVKDAEQEELNRIDRERREAELAAEEAREAEQRKAEKEREEKIKARVAGLYKHSKAEDAGEDQDGAEIDAEEAEDSLQPEAASKKPDDDDDGDIWSSLRS